ncbi:hypothetical protein Hanom_Chr12g01089551 [Helianthus anomalus]
MAQISSKKAPTTRGRRRSGSNPNFQLFIIWVIIVILTLLPPSSGHHHHHHHRHNHQSSVSSIRKDMLFKTRQPHEFHAAGKEGSIVFDEDKRIIHTGPNPLHN